MALNDLRGKLDYIFLRDGGNIDSLRIPGIYILNNTHTGTLPTGLSNLTNCILEVYGDIQILKSANTSLTGSFSRKYSSGSWSTWKDIINLDEISNHFIRKDVPQTLSQAEKNQFLTNSRLLDFFVRYDTSQSLTQAQKQQFRQNAGIPDALVNGYENPIDPIAYFNATGQNYFLQVGEVAKIDFTAQTSVPLRIQTTNNTYYEFHLIPSNTGGTSGAANSPIFLNPNNTTYSGSFYYAQVYRFSDDFVGSYEQHSSFRIGISFSSIFAIITNRDVYKNIKGIYDSYGYYLYYPRLTVFSTDWRDTTTSWLYLGTIVFPQSSSGTILVRRLL
jgi:hypothetical protein